MALNQRRMISSKIWEDEKFNKLTANEKLLYIGMITIADDEGRFHADPRFLHARIFLYANRISKNLVTTMTKKIEEVELITLYSTKKGLVGYHPGWSKHNKVPPTKAKPSQIPPPPADKLQISCSQDAEVSKDKESKDKEREYNGTQQILDNLPENHPIRRKKELADNKITTNDIPF